MRRKVAVAGASLCALALLALAVNLVSRRPAPPQPAVPVPAVAPPMAAPEPADPTRELVLAQAERLVHDVVAEGELHPVLARWRDRYAPDARFRFEGLDGRRWITVTAARVDCGWADEVLRRNADLGDADNCARWTEKAREAMERYGIADRSPAQFLEDLGAEQSVRVLLVYAGWQRTGEGDDEVSLVASAPVLVYPQRDFPARENAALDRIYRAMKLGPYAEDQALASLE
jgi:hypothetical protein